MKLSLFIGKPFGTRLYIHWTFLFLLMWVALNAYRAGSSSLQVIYAMLFMLSVFACVLMHELGHALAGRKLGYLTRKITLLPIGGIASMEGIPDNPIHELKVTAAGPAVNFVLALLLSPVFLFTRTPNVDFLHLTGWSDFVASLFFVNVSLLLFNLLPAFPMDGGRILRALLAMRSGDRVKATGIASFIGKGFGGLFFIAGIFFNPFLAVIGIFVFLMAQAENEMVRSGNLIKNHTVSDVMITNYHSLSVSDTVEDAADRLLDVQAKDFVILKEGNLAGTLSQSEIIRALSTREHTSPVATVMNTHYSVIDLKTSIEDVFSLLQRNGNSIIPVVEGGKLMGIVDSTNVREFMLIQQARNTNKGIFN
jgi:Zn-dependent protease